MIFGGWWLLTLHSRGSVGEHEGPLARGARTVQLDHHHSLHLLLLPAWRSQTPWSHSYAGLVPNLAPRTHLTSLTTEQPPLVSGPRTHPPISGPASRAPMAEGWPVGMRRQASQQPTGFEPRRSLCEARAMHGVLLQELRWKVGSNVLPSLPGETLAAHQSHKSCEGPSLKAFGRPLLLAQKLHFLVHWSCVAQLD